MTLTKDKKGKIHSKLVDPRSVKVACKQDCWLPEDTNMYDTCWCDCNCATPCGRNSKNCNQFYQHCTVSDFSDICERYVEDKPKYKLIRMKPRVDPFHPKQWSNGEWIEKEIELTEEDYGLILDALYEQALMQEIAVCYGRKPKTVKNKYSESCRKLAKKFERIFNGK